MKILSIVAACVSLAFAGAAPAQEAVSVQTRVDFSSSPEGARVSVDGVERGVAPCALTELAPGVHRVKFQLDGFAPRDAFVDVAANRPVQCHGALETEKGLLLVKGLEGCDIVVDGVSVGTSPRLVTTLDAKDVHRVQLRKTGYLPGEFDVRFDGRRPYVLDEELVLNSGVVEVTSEPAGAEVMVNGIVRGVTPLTVSGLPNGTATVRLRQDGFREETRELVVKAGERQMLSLALTGLPGTLVLTSVPEGARFYVDGKFRGKSPLTVTALQPGDYVVRAELEGFGTQERTVTVENGAMPREEFRLANRKGRLEIRSSPVGAEVVVDGRVAGVTKAKDPEAEFSDIFAVENLLDGEHVVLLRLDGFDDVTRRPVVESQKTAQLKVRMKRLFIPNVEIDTDTGTVTGVLVGNAPDVITVEVKMGITRGFRKSEIRKIRFLK